MRQQLGEFLRRRRELLSPLEVGLLAEPRRRTPGLLLMQPVAGTPAGERLERLATHS